MPVQEAFGHVVDDALTEGIQAEVELGIEFGHRAKIQVGLQVQA